MDYKKKYEDAIERAKRWADGTLQPDRTTPQGVCEAIFPELAESEDERIRKEIVSALKFANDGGVYDKHIAYLEKQKEQKPNIELIQRSWYMQGYHDGENHTEPKWIITAREGGPVYRENPRYGESLEPKQEWSEDDEANLKAIIRIIEDNDSDWEELTKWLKSLRPQPKHNMSIGYMHYLDEHRPDGKMCLSNAECTQLEKAFEREDWDTILRYADKYCQKPAKEWREEDEKMLRDVYESLFAYLCDLRGDENPDTELLDQVEKEKQWIKSLPERLRPQPKWKPSEAQMNELHGALIPGHGYDCDVLQGLYADLKKLMEDEK